MSSINSLVGPAPTTFTRSHGPTNTWLDNYIDNPNLNNQGYNTLELRPGMDGFNGPPTLTQIPNYRPGSDTGITPLVASDRGFLRDLIRFGQGEDPGSGYEQWLLNEQKNKIFENDSSTISQLPSSPRPGQQRMAGMNQDIINLLIG